MESGSGEAERVVTVWVVTLEGVHCSRIECILDSLEDAKKCADLVKSEQPDQWHDVRVHEYVVGMIPPLYHEPVYTSEVPLKRPRSHWEP